eukprot:1035550-Ditylum_brightwellii.AAC.1
MPPPLAPPGTRVIVYENAKIRWTFGFNVVDGWYVGPAPHHYHCYRCHIKKTNQEHISDMVEFFPHTCAMPKTASKDAAIHA